MRRLLGLDIAITAENRACVTDETGKVLAERRFGLVRSELEALHEVASKDLEPGQELVVTMEPTGSSLPSPPVDEAHEEDVTLSGVRAWLPLGIQNGKIIPASPGLAASEGGEH